MAAAHVTDLSGIERGKRNPSLKNLRKIAVALGVGVEELFCFEGSEP
ncbi:MAG: helix-turn-helix transcriptional regulator [Chloroflexi bacterium]|nr:helix-turn-helix transcriptional regulator [Chloroflexota bacterium]